MIFISMMRNLLTLCKRENLHKVAIMVGLLIFSGSLAFWLLEPKVSLADSLWWGGGHLHHGGVRRHQPGHLRRQNRGRLA